MTKRLGAGVVSALVASAALRAADVWESKPFHTWTDKELEQVLTSSPWAGKASITYVHNRANQPPIQEVATVTWASSRVMRQALAREEFGTTANVSQEAAAVIAQTPSFYMVTVRISNGVNSASHAGRASTMQTETYLLLRSKPPIPATQAEGQVLEPEGKPAQSPQNPSPGGAAPGGAAFSATPAAQRAGSGGATSGGQRGSGGGTASGSAGRGAPVGGRGARGGRGDLPPTTASIVIFRFPRDPITLEDKEVEFVTKLCGSGFGGGLPVAPVPGAGGLQFELANAAQRSGGGSPSGGSPSGGMPVIIPGPSTGPGPGVRMGDQLPSCNYHVKRKFKLKDMVVKGELSL